MDSGALDPLYGLDNVKYFSLDFKKAGGEEELPQKLLDMAQDMKLSIERRYLARSCKGELLGRCGVNSECKPLSAWNPGFDRI